MTTSTAPTAAARRRRRQQAGTRVVTAALYARLSMDRHKNGTAVARQLADGQALAALKGWRIPPELIFTDNDISATSGKTRPEFERLLKAITDGRCQAVIVWHMDRLVRLTTDLLKVIEAGRDDGFSITAVHGPSLDMSDPTGVAVAQILTAIAEMEVKHKAERQFNANLAQREAGVMPWKKCYGYDSATAKIIEEEAVIVRAVFDRFNGGAGIWTITKWLNDQGLKNSVGTAWTRQQVRDLLTNPRFIAKSTLADGVRTREIIGDGQWEPIVSEAVFRTAGNVLRSPERLRFGRKGSARKWLGAGFYSCGVCSAKVVSTYSSGTKIDPTTGKPITVRAYKCPEGRHIWRAAEEVDDFIVAEIAHTMNTSDSVRTALAADPEGGSEVAVLTARRIEQSRLFDSMVAEMDAARTPEVVSRIAKAMERKASVIADIDGRLDELSGTSPLARLAGEDHPGSVWRFDLDVNTQIAIGNKVCRRIALLPLKPGRRPKAFDIASTVEIDYAAESA